MSSTSPPFAGLPTDLADKVRASIADLQPHMAKYQSDSWLKPRDFRAFSVDELIEMTHFIDPALPIKFQSHRKAPVGPILAWIKQKVAFIMHPILHVCLRRQQSFNELSWVLAQAVILLEIRVSELEAREAKRASK